VGFVPLQYLRPRGALAPAYEHPLPLFALLRESKFKSEPGDEVIAFSETSDGVFAAKDVVAYQSFIKSSLANDYEGLRQMVAAGQVVKLDTLTRLHVIDRTENPFIGKGVPALEARVKDGPYKGKSVWIAEQFVARLKIGVKANPKTPPPSSSPPGRRR
jgi:hypothetical protein